MPVQTEGFYFFFLQRSTAGRYCKDFFEKARERMFRGVGRCGKRLLTLFRIKSITLHLVLPVFLNRRAVFPLLFAEF
jgi:hypothetical protein